MPSRELKRPSKKVFRWVDDVPLASATIGQVHKATLRGGAKVVIKVQHKVRGRPAVISHWVPSFPCPANQGYRDGGRGRAVAFVADLQTVALSLSLETLDQGDPHH